MLSIKHKTDIIDQYELDTEDNVVKNWLHEAYFRDEIDGDYFLHFQGDLHLNRSLELDWKHMNTDHVLFQLEHNLELADFQRSLGLVVDGNLTVDGAVVNMVMEGGLLLLVTGRLEASHLVASGSAISVRGDAYIREVTWPRYHDGTLHIRGDFYTFLLADDDEHYFVVNGERYYISAYDELVAVYIADRDYQVDEEDCPIPDTIQPWLYPDITSFGDIQTHAEQGKPVVTTQAVEIMRRVQERLTLLRAIERKKSNKENQAEVDKLPSSEEYLARLINGDIEFDKIPKAKLTELHCLHYAKGFEVLTGANIFNIPEHLRTIEVCRVAVRRSVVANAGVPAAIKPYLDG